MGLLAGIAWAVLSLLGALLAYAAVSALLLLYVRIPDESPYDLLEDLVFALTLPFVLALLLASTARRAR